MLGAGQRSRRAQRADRSLTLIYVWQGLQECGAAQGRLELLTPSCPGSRHTEQGESGLDLGDSGAISTLQPSVSRSSRRGSSDPCPRCCSRAGLRRCFRFMRAIQRLHQELLLGGTVRLGQELPGRGGEGTREAVRKP